MDKTQLTNAISNALEKILVDGTGMLPFVKPDVEDVVAKINRLSGNDLGLRRPKDFFDRRLLVDVLDHASKDYTRNSIAVAATTGGVTGTVGIAGVLVDLPVLVSASVGLVRRQALVYGFTEIEDGKSDETERINLLIAFGTALGADMAITKISERLAVEAGKLVTTQTVKSYLLRQVSEEMAVKILAKWLPRALPLIAVFGNAVLDGIFLSAIGAASRKDYRGRHLLVRKQAAQGSNLDEVLSTMIPSRVLRLPSGPSPAPAAG